MGEYFATEQNVYFTNLVIGLLDIACWKSSSYNRSWKLASAV